MRFKESFQWAVYSSHLVLVPPSSPKYVPSFSILHMPVPASFLILWPWLTEKQWHPHSISPHTWGIQGLCQRMYVLNQSVWMHSDWHATPVSSYTQPSLQPHPNILTQINAIGLQLFCIDKGSGLILATQIFSFNETQSCHYCYKASLICISPHPSVTSINATVNNSRFSKS